MNFYDILMSPLEKRILAEVRKKSFLRLWGMCWKSVMGQALTFNIITHLQ
ncbi:MAG: hypothetical protein RO469_02130 [Thermincola sp.]|nr:hypothetical protein [Thermincola sp.]